MSRVIPNDFTSYELTEKEEIDGSVLTTLQKQRIQNALSNAAMEKNSLSFDPTNPTRFAQQEASLKGQMDAYRFILDSSAIAEEALNQSNITLDTEE